MKRHPAKFTKALLDKMLEEWPAWGHGPILDPFAGTGKVHSLADKLGLQSIGVELEPEWASQHERTIVGNALHLPFANNTFGSIVTSPCYGNRMADNHTARDKCRRCDGYGRLLTGELLKTKPCPACNGSKLSRRNTYRHALERPLSDNSGAGLQWGVKYQNFHERAWQEALRVLRPEGLLVLNIKDHIRGGEIQPVSDWHASALAWVGLRLEALHEVPCPGNRQGANGELRVDHEYVMLFRAP